MWKKIISFFIVVFISVYSHAQFKKGDRMVGVNIGGTSFSSGKSDFTSPGISQGYETKSNSFALSIGPSIGWFISDKTVVGVSLSVGYSSTKLTNIAKDTTFGKNNSNQFTLGAGGFLRNYFNTTGNFFPFGQISVNFGTGSGKFDGFNFGSDIVGQYKDSYDGKKSGIAFLNAALTAGFTKMVSKSVGLDFYAGYIFSYNKNNTTNTTVRAYSNGSPGYTAKSDIDEKFSSHGFTLGVGFQLFFEKKK